MATQTIMASTPTMKDDLSFMGTTKITDTEDREQAVKDRAAARDTFKNGPDENGCHRRNRFTDLSNIKVAGGKAAGPKPIKANYDADDARIVDLKQQGYTDEYVADKLAQEGRIRYHARTVGSRWLRIRKALEAKEEEMLEDEMSDWHEGEDERLEQAVYEIDAKIDGEIAKLKEKKWLQVAAHVADLINKKRYTPKLCKERWDGLMDGSALMPIELDPDQEGRAKKRRDRIANNKRLREEAAIAQEHEEERKLAAAAAKKEIRTANAVVRITRAQQRKIEEEQINKMKKESVEMRKKQKLIIRQWIAYNKAEATWLNRKQSIERIISNKLLGLALSYRPPRNKHAEEEEEIFEEEDEIIEEETEDEEDDNIIICQTTRKHLRSSASDSDNPAPHKKNTGYVSPASTTRSSPRLRKSTSPRHVAIGQAPVTDKTRTNPRTIMTLGELDMALRFRGIPGVSGAESHEQVIARFDMEDNLLSCSDLREILHRYAFNAPSTQSKSELIKDIQEYEASRSLAGEQA